MEQKLGRGPVLGGILLAAGGAYGLRVLQLGGKSVGLGWVSLAVMVLFAVYALSLQPRQEAEVMEERSMLALILALAGSGAMAVGSVAMAMSLERQRDVLLGAGGVVTALCFAVAGAERYRGRKVHPGILMVPTVFFAVELVVNFRDWSRDPIIGDYCFALLALISAMIASYYLAGFSFEKGRRRAAVFFCAAGVFFAAAAVPGERIRTLAMNLGTACWLFSNLLALLRTPPKTERRRRLPRI